MAKSQISFQFPSTVCKIVGIKFGSMIHSELLYMVQGVY